MKNSSAEYSNQEIEILDFEKKYAGEILLIQAETELSAWTENDYLSELERDDSIFKVALKNENEVAGFALVRLLLGNSKTSEIAFDSAEILNIAVRNSLQKNGVGQMIFDEILRSLAKKNIGEIWLEVRKSNAKAIGFYLKNNFELRYERKNYYGNPIEDALVLQRLTVR